MIRITHTVLDVVLIGSALSSVFAADHKTPSDVTMTRPEECLTVLDGIAHHASWVELRDGRILMVWGGIRYPTWFTTSSDGGTTWAKSEVVHDASGGLLGAHDAHSLIRLAGNAIGYANRTRNGANQPEYMQFWRSEDDGKHWQKPIHMGPAVDHEVISIHDGFLRTSSGRIILPVYGRIELAQDPTDPKPQIGALIRNQWIGIAVHEYDSRFSWSYVIYSDDDGLTWKPGRSGKLLVWDPDTMSWHRTSQPTVAEVSPGKLLMLLRTDLGRLYQSWSYDNGDTWSLPKPSSLAAPSFPAQLRTIPATGDLLVVWTQTDREEIRKGLGRSRLSTAISRRHGAQGSLWEFYQNIESTLAGTRVEPGPIRFTRPEGIVFAQGGAAAVREPKYIVNLPDDYARMACPSVFFYKDRVLIANAYEGQFKNDGTFTYGRLKIVPLSWLYGGPANVNGNHFSEDLKKRFPPK